MREREGGEKGRIFFSLPYSISRRDDSAKRAFRFTLSDEVREEERGTTRKGERGRVEDLRARCVREGLSRVGFRICDSECC